VGAEGEGQALPQRLSQQGRQRPGDGQRPHHPGPEEVPAPHVPDTVIVRSLTVCVCVCVCVCGVRVRVSVCVCVVCVVWRVRW
jgi:hypothetical protein